MFVPIQFLISSNNLILIFKNLFKIKNYMPGIYGTPSPFAFSFISLRVEQAEIGDSIRKNSIKIFFIIINYN